MSADIRVAAVDLGATSGRVMAATVGPGKLDLVEAHRFANGPVRVAHRGGSTLHWDILALHRETVAGIAAAHRIAPIHAIGIDSWAVDYGLLDARGGLLGNPVHYRDSRTQGMIERVGAVVPDLGLYAISGLQQLPFNTIYQLVSEHDSGRLDAAEHLLLIPDLLAYWLTGKVGAERTNASTTQLYDVRTRGWAADLAERVGIPPRLLPPLWSPGDLIGALVPDIAREAALPRIPVIAVGSHDTASAVVGVPAEPGSRHAYISSGTWSLVGLELDEPILTEAAMAANFTNETGVDGTIRFLRNVMGLWVLSELVRTWRTTDATVDLSALLAAASKAPPLAAVIDINDPSLLPPGDMEGRIERLCRVTGQTAPDTKAALVRCVIDSLALAYRRTVRQAADLSGHGVDVVHIVGGGVRNELLCRLTADACGVPTLAGPVEAAALGNALVQARTLGADLVDLAAMRALIRDTHSVRRYEPAGNDTTWDDAEARIHHDAPRRVS